MKFRNWELSFIAALLAALMFGSSVSREQAELSGKLIRLHVVANSDSERDQALKLRVRDAVLSSLSGHLSGVRDAGEARGVIYGQLAAAEDAALREIRASGLSCGVKASLREEDFPTREYDTFSLPAGRYTALRVEIGEGLGRNWWCVVFPPLCAPDAVETVAAILDEGEISLITEREGAVARFKCMELISKIKTLFKK
ncbi:MAG: stage II sporulation protein R [Oscillospiraceae bacterium]|jgi:stage II sporulation protein R|nr:stage II sporulation protein R [Oscillospiraceae bacterium]